MDSKDVRPTPVLRGFPFLYFYEDFLLSVLGNSGANTQLCVTIRVFVDYDF